MLENVEIWALAPILPTVIAGPDWPPVLAGEERQADWAELPAATTMWIPEVEAAEMAALREETVDEVSRDMLITEPMKADEWERLVWDWMA